MYFRLFWLLVFSLALEFLERNISVFLIEKSSVNYLSLNVLVYLSNYLSIFLLKTSFALAFLNPFAGELLDLLPSK